MFLQLQEIVLGCWGFREVVIYDMDISYRQYYMVVIYYRYQFCGSLDSIIGLV